MARERKLPGHEDIMIAWLKNLFKKPESRPLTVVAHEQYICYLEDAIKQERVWLQDTKDASLFDYHSKRLKQFESELCRFSASS